MPYLDYIGLQRFKEKLDIIHEPYNEIAAKPTPYVFRNPNRKMWSEKEGISGE